MNTTMDLQKYIGKEVSVETLTGRNFHHYLNGQLAELDEVAYDFPDLELCVSEEDEESDLDDDIIEDEDFDDDSLIDYVPKDCWIKRFSAIEEEGQEAYYLLYIEVDIKTQEITSIGCVTEYVRRAGSFECFSIFAPGIEMPATKQYVDNNAPSETVLNEMKRVIAGRILKKDQSFIDFRLPQSIINEGGNGGGNEEYIVTLQSAYRLAYMDISFDTTEEGEIEFLSYDTWQSSGSAYGDMFSRPVSLSDREDEAMDILLYVIDQYTDEEYKNL